MQFTDINKLQKSFADASKTKKTLVVCAQRENGFKRDAFRNANQINDVCFADSAGLAPAILNQSVTLIRTQRTRETLWRGDGI